MLQRCSRNAPRDVLRDPPGIVQGILQGWSKGCSRDAPEMLQGCSRVSPRAASSQHHHDAPPALARTWRDPEGAGTVQPGSTSAPESRMSGACPCGDGDSQGGRWERWWLGSSTLSPQLSCPLGDIPWAGSKPPQGSACPPGSAGGRRNGPVSPGPRRWWSSAGSA